MVATGAAVVAIVAGILLVRPGWVASLDSQVCDFMAGWVDRGRPSGDVVLVEIDEKSLDRLGRWPWPRDLLGALVERAAAGGAATVVLDILLSEPDRGTTSANYAELAGVPRRGATNDEVLAAALSSVPVVVGYSMQFEGETAAACSPPSLPLVMAGPEESVGKALFQASSIVCPLPALAKAAGGSGFLNAAPDPDGKLRLLPLIIERGGQYYPSLALAALNAYRHWSRVELRTDARGVGWLRLDSQSVPLEARGHLRLRYRGPKRTFSYISSADLLDGRVPAEKLRGKIAIIGPSAHGVQNIVVTPTDPLFPDLELHATAIDNLLRGDFFHRPSGGYIWEILVALVAGAASILTMVLIRSLWGGLITAAMAVGAWCGCAMLLSAGGVLLSPLPATGVLACNFIVLTMLQHRTERKRADQTELQLVSAEERTEEVRQQSESRYRRLVENVNDAIVINDIEGRLLFANQRFREWFGLEHRDLGELVLEEYVAPEWQAAVREHHRLRLAGAAVPEHLEYEGIRADSTRIWIEAQVTTVEEGGQIVGTQSALRDITERKRLEAQYLQAQKMESVGRLAGGVAHDFNNLLMVINGYSAMLAARLGDDSELLEMVQEIEAAGKRAAELVMQLLIFSRKQLVQPKALDLNLLVKEAQRMFVRVVGEDVEVVSKLSPGLEQVMMDPGQMHQVLMNLVVNARDSMPEGGKLTIETKNVEVDEGTAGRHPEVQPGSYVYLGITDTGMGMSEEIQRRMFEPFFTTKEKGKGTGLGLAMVHSIVRQGGGGIWADSQPGAGTTFHIYLPQMQAATSTATATSRAAAPHRRIGDGAPGGG